METRFRIPQRIVFLAAVIVLAAFPLATPATAQNITTTGATIVGRVTDKSQGVLPGVTVTATSPALQVQQVTAVTNEVGEYRLTPLPIGTYTVQYALGGFLTVRREGIRLTAGFTAKLDVVMNVGQLEETVTVKGTAPVVDVASTTITTHVTKEVLDAIPTGRNAYTGLLELAPGARTTAIDVGGGAISSTPRFINFGMTEEAWPAVDGVVTKTNNISDSGNFPDFNTAEEATVTTMGHDASIPQRGVAINLIVKSGGNDFHGSVSFGGTHRSLESRNPAGGALKNRTDFSGDLGGRLIRDKLWFYLGLRKQHQERDVLSCFKPDGSPCSTMNNSKFVTSKVTYQINPSNKLTGFLWWNFRHDLAIAAPTQWSARRNWGGEPGATKLEWQGQKGNNFVASVLAGAWWTRSWTRCIEETCGMIAGRDRGTGAQWGLSTRAGEEALEMRRQLKVAASLFRPSGFGNHDIKFGAEYYNDPYRRKQLDRGAGRNYRLNYLNGVPDRIEIYNLPLLKPDNLGNYIGLYVADSWTIGRKLTLNLGVRYAHDSWREAAGCKDASPAPAHLAFPATCWDETVMPLYQMVVPRLRAAYDLTGDGKTVIKGGWGRYAKLRLFDHLQPMANNVISTAVYRWRDLNGNRDYDPGEVSLNPNGSDFLSLTLTGTFSSAGRGVVNPDEKQPYTDEYSLQFERQLGPTLAVRFLGLHARVGNTQRLANRLRPYSAYNIPITSPDPGVDGVIGTADDTGKSITWYDYPASLAGAAFQQAIYVYDPAAREKYNAVEVAVSRRLSNNWQFQASYSATKKHIPLTPNEDEFNTQDPNSEIFAENKTWEWLARASGSYLFPHGILFSARYEHRSGNPWARTAILRGGRQIPNITVRVEPIGSQRLPNINIVSLRGEKRFSVQRGRELLLRTDLANALNTTVATAITSLSGANYGLVSARVLPRIVTFEVQYRF